MNEYKLQTTGHKNESDLNKLTKKTWYPNK